MALKGWTQFDWPTLADELYYTGWAKEHFRHVLFYSNPNSLGGLDWYCGTCMRFVLIDGEDPRFIEPW